MSQFLNPTYIISILIAISVHEWAHAFVANRLGDPTAEREGRLTLNPVAHIDLIGALMFVIVGFGWAKPVPVNPLYFKKPNRDMALVAIAGPVSNFILAFIAFIGTSLITSANNLSVADLLGGVNTGSAATTVVLQILASSLFVNLALMAFNLLPIAPLDGSNVLRNFIPRRQQDKYDEYLRIGPFILLGLIIAESILPIAIISTWVFTIVNAVLNGFAAVAGLIS